MSAFVAAASAVCQGMAGMVTDWMGAVAMNIIVATACSTCVVMMEWVFIISMDAFVATAGAIFQCMARVMGDWICRCSHDICRSIDEVQLDFLLKPRNFVLWLRRLWEFW